ncbi:MAG TPA: NUDIX hydrolase [Xanthobacteraceae bacterium]|nr:NUDIX hydrolase [Xanthobacteraceae bacterium]
MRPVGAVKFAHPRKAEDGKERDLQMTTDPHARLAEFLSIGDSKQNLPGVKIRDAATMLVIDRTGPTPKVLLGRRHHGHKFMPGKYVFPGGRVERADRRASAATPLDKRVEARLMKEVRYPSPEKSRGFPLAAIREVFEETGLVLGTKVDSGSFPTRAGEQRTGKGPAHPPDDEWAKFARTGVAPDLAAVHFVARAITPPGRPRRFDTRFFAVDANAIAARVEGVVGLDTELVELVWLPIEESLKLDMPGITMAVLEELKIRTAEGFAHDLPVPFYRMRHGTRLRELLD